LYLSNPEAFNIWVNKTEEGLQAVGRISELAGTWAEKYATFNEAAIAFRGTSRLLPQEIDWTLTFLATNVEATGDGFFIDEDILGATEVPVAVDDRPVIDDVVGAPMELRVMRWTPINEMGVIALFIEFRKDLGFPIVDFIRASFPDAAVFQTAGERNARRYVEFEFKSSGFKRHLGSKRPCDYVVCWEHDWKECPVEVIELRKEIARILS
jgi:hypothetical protein